VGFPCGLVSGGDEAEGLVCVGDEYVPLKSHQYALWLALGRPGNPDADAFLQERYRDSDTPDSVMDLLRLGLLVRLSGDPAKDQPALKRMRLHLLAVGIGRGNGDGSKMFFAPSQGRMVGLEPAVYFVLIRAHNEQSLWDLCTHCASDLNLEVDELVETVLGALPDMLGTDSAFLDRVG